MAAPIRRRRWKASFLGAFINTCVVGIINGKRIRTAGGQGKTRYSAARIAINEITGASIVSPFKDTLHIQAIRGAFWYGDRRGKPGPIAPSAPRHVVTLVRFDDDVPSVVRWKNEFLVC